MAAAVATEIAQPCDEHTICILLNCFQLPSVALIRMSIPEKNFKKLPRDLQRAHRFPAIVLTCRAQ
jgi:hypothetical protein